MLKKILFVLFMYLSALCFAAGSYTGTHWDTGASGCNYPTGIASDGTYIYVLDSSDNEVYVFTKSGTYQGKWSLANDFNEIAISYVEGFFYTVGEYSATYDYYPTMNVYEDEAKVDSLNFEGIIGVYHSLSGVFGSFEYVYAVDGAYDDVYKINYLGNSTVYDVYNPADNPKSIFQIGTNFYILAGSYLYKFNSSFVYQSESINLTNNGTGYAYPSAACYDGEYIYTVNQVDDEVYVYSLGDTVAEFIPSGISYKRYPVS